MPFRCVELVKVIFCQLHLGAVQHLEAHAHEDILDLVQGDIHGVAVAQLHRLAGDGHVHLLQLQPGVQGGLLDPLLLLLQGGGQGLTHFVGELTDNGPLLGGQAAHLLEDGGERTLLPQVFDPQRIQVLGRLGLGEGRKGLAPDLFQFFLHKIAAPLRIFTIKKAPHPIQGTKGKPSAVPPTIRTAPGAHSTPSNGGQPSTSFPAAAPGRTKRSVRSLALSR